MLQILGTGVITAGTVAFLSAVVLEFVCCWGRSLAEHQALTRHPMHWSGCVSDHRGDGAVCQAFGGSHRPRPRRLELQQKQVNV